jgi:hypothetical protein
MFFLEKKNQKTFTSPVASLPEKNRDSTPKSFLLLFYKKEGLPNSSSPPDL